MGNRITYYLKSLNKPIVFESDEDRSLNEVVNDLSSSLKEMGLSKCSEKEKCLIIKNDDVLAVLIEKTKKRKSLNKDKIIETQHVTTTPIEEHEKKQEEIVEEDKTLKENNIPEINLDLPEIDNNIKEKIILEEEDDINDVSNINDNLTGAIDNV